MLPTPIVQPRSLEHAQFQRERELKEAISVALERAVALGVTQPVAMRAWAAIGSAGRTFVAARVRAIGVPAARIVSVVSSDELARIRAITRMWLGQLEPELEEVLLGSMLACLVDKLAEEGTRLRIADCSSARELGCTALGLFDALFAPAGDARIAQLVARSTSRVALAPSDPYSRNVGALAESGKWQNGRGRHAGGLNPSAATRRREPAIVMPKSHATQSKNTEYATTVTQAVVHMKSTR
jgi:hypothetical protein